MILRACVLLSLLCSVSGGQSVTADDFELTIATEKQQFLTGEVVDVNVRFKNLRNVDREMQYLMLPVSLLFQIEGSNGTTYPYKGIFLHMPGKNADRIGGNEVRDYLLTLNRSYGESRSIHSEIRYFPPGQYVVTALCIPEWGGDTLASNTLRFDVLQPIGDEKDVFSLMMKGQELYWKFSDAFPECVKTFQGIIELHPNSVYRLEAYCILVQAFIWGGDSTSARTYALEGISQYSNSLKVRELVGPLVFSLPTDSKVAYLDQLSKQFPNSSVANHCEYTINEIKLDPKRFGKR